MSDFGKGVDDLYDVRHSLDRLAKAFHEVGNYPMSERMADLATQVNSSIKMVSDGYGEAVQQALQGAKARNRDILALAVNGCLNQSAEIDGNTFIGGCEDD